MAAAAAATTPSTTTIEVILTHLSDPFSLLVSHSLFLIQQKGPILTSPQVAIHPLLVPPRPSTRHRRIQPHELALPYLGQFLHLHPRVGPQLPLQVAHNLYAQARSHGAANLEEEEFPPRRVLFEDPTAVVARVAGGAGTGEPCAPGGERALFRTTGARPVDEVVGAEELGCGAVTHCTLFLFGILVCLFASKRGGGC